MHTIFDENTIEKITAAWWEEYRNCYLKRSPQEEIEHSQNMYNDYHKTLQKIRNSGIELGEKDKNSIADYSATNKAIGESGNTGYTEPSIPPGNDKILKKVTIKEALVHIANWYVNNVYTYQAGEYGAHRYNKNATTIDQVKIYYDGNGKTTLLDANYSPIYLAGNNGRVGRAKIGNSNTDIAIDEQENLYQYYFKVYLQQDLAGAGNGAKKKRMEVLESQSKKLNADQDPIHIVGENEIFEPLNNVDIWKLYEYAFLKSKGRTDTPPTSRAGYYNSDVNQYVYDDCSGFVSAVIGYLLKHNSTDYKYKTYNSSNFYNGSDSVNELLSKYNFECYEGNQLTKKPLKYGDILVTERHVEFYIDSGKSFGWGRMHSTFDGNDKNIRFEPKFNVDNNGEYYYLGDGRKYTKVYRYVG